MKDKRQRVALAWPYGLATDPAFYAYLVNAAAAAASHLSQYSYAAAPPQPHHHVQSSPPPFNYAAGSSSATAAAMIQRGGYPQFPAPPPSFPVGLAAAAAAAAVARTPAGASHQPVATSAALQAEVAPRSCVTSRSPADLFMSPYGDNSLLLPARTSSPSTSPTAHHQQNAAVLQREHRGSVGSSTLFQPYKTDSDLSLIHI